MRNIDKQSYKTQYHFKDRYPSILSKGEEYPSLEQDPKINFTITKNNERSNVEIEKDEVVLDPTLKALFKARGKKHSGGGIDVLLKPESFIFSDDPSLHITEKEHKLFEFKLGGKFKKQKSTPADVLKRNVDIEHYNKMTANITDPKKDDIAKRSSALMLQKYLETVGNVAYLQEQKKDFPDGLPFFSEGTAPIYDQNLKEEVMEQKQYARFGGRINPKAQLGKYLLPKTDYPKTSNDTEIPFGFNSKWWIRKNGQMIEVPKPSQHTALDPTNDYLNKIANPETTNTTIATPSTAVAATKARVESNGKYSGVPANPHYSGVEPLQGVLPGRPHTDIPLKTIEAGTPSAIIPNPSSTKDVSGPQDTGYNPEWEFTPYQRESQAYNALKYASAKRYMPFRSRLNPSYLDANLVNPEQTIGDIQGATNKQIDSLGSLNPILRNAQAQSAFGEYIDKIPGIRSQYDAQNAQITNQTRGVNTQIANSAKGVNMQNDQQYYQQSVTGQQNFDNLKTFLGDQYMNNRMQDVQDNQSLAYTLLQQDNPAYLFDYRTGQFKPNPKRSILNLKSDKKSDMLETLLGKINFEGLTPDQRLKYLEIITKNKGLQYLK